MSICTECAICIVSMRGSILDTGPRATMHYWLYIKLGKNYRVVKNGNMYLLSIFLAVVIIIDVVWLSMGIWWLVKFYIACPVGNPREILLSKAACLLVKANNALKLIDFIL